MAKLTEPSFSSGKREDLADLIAMVDAKDTPFTSMAPKGSKPGNTLFRWQVDRLPAAAADQTGIVDGTDVDPNGATIQNFVKDGATQYRYEISNHIQEFRKAVRVSPLTLDIAVVAGVRDELANNVAKGITMLKRDMEKTFCSNNLPKADNGTTQGCFIFDMVSKQFSLHEITATAGYNDMRNDTLYLLQSNLVKPWDSGTALNYTWKSKVFTMPQYIGMGCAHVEAETYPVTFILWADGVQVHTQDVTNRQPFRLPPIKARDWEYQVTGTGEVFAVCVATSMGELAGA